MAPAAGGIHPSVSGLASGRLFRFHGYQRRRANGANRRTAARTAGKHKSEQGEARMTMDTPLLQGRRSIGRPGGAGTSEIAAGPRGWATLGHKRVHGERGAQEGT